MTREDTTLITRVRLRNYKSIAACDVSLHAFTILVGPNGAGKSNFLDALRLVADALRNSLDHALRDRGGVSEVRRRSGGHPNNFGIRLDFRLIDQAKLTARFDLGRARSAAPSFDKLVREVCKLLQCDPVSSEVVAAAGDAPPEN